MKYEFSEDEVKAFKEVGYEFTGDEVHEFFKRKYGFTKKVTLRNGEIVAMTRSISDKSEEVDIKIMTELIDFIIRWVAINLEYRICIENDSIVWYNAS